MNVDEKSKFTIPYQLLYGTRGLPRNIHPKTDLTFNIHLIQIKHQVHNQLAGFNQVATVDTEIQIDPPPQQDIPNLQVITDLSIDTAMHPPTSGQEEIETQQTEKVEIPEEDPQDKGEFDGATEAFIDEVGTDLAAHVADEFNPVSTIVHKFTRKLQSFLAKGLQMNNDT